MPFQAGVPGLRPHDLRRSAARDMARLEFWGTNESHEQSLA